MKVIKKIFITFCTCLALSPEIANTAIQTNTVVVDASMKKAKTKRAKLNRARKNLETNFNFSHKGVMLLPKDVVYAVNKHGSTDKIYISGATVGKLFLKVLRRTPKPIRKIVYKMIRKHTTLGIFVKVLDAYTGTTHHILYSAFRHIHINKTWSNNLANIVSAFLPI